MTMNELLKDAGGVAEGGDVGVREITDHLPGAVYRLCIHPDGRLSLPYVSKGVADLIGVDKATAEKDVNALFALVVAEDLPGLRKTIGEVAADLKQITYDFRFRHARTGELRWLRSSAAPYRNADGTVVCDGFWQDVSAELAAETRAVAAQDRLQMVAESAPGAVFQVRREKNGSFVIAYVSDGILALSGLTREQCESSFALLFGRILEQDQPVMLQAIAQSAAGMTPILLDYRYRHMNGEQRWVRCATATPMREAGGSIVWNGFWQDITATKLLETQLAQARDAAEAAERKLREITDHLPGMVYQIGFNAAMKAEFTMVSEGVRELYGITPEALLADSMLIQNMLAKEDLPMIWGKQLAALRSGKQTFYDFRVRLPDGSWRWHRTTANPRLSSDGIATFNGFTMDITAEKALEGQLIAARDAAQGAEQRMRAIFDHTRIGIVLIDKNRQFSNANPTLRELLSIEDEQEFARDFPAFSPPFQPDGRPSMEKAGEVIDAAFATGYHRFDWMHQTRAGDPRPCEIALTRIELGGEPHIFATMSDQRERREQVAALKAATEAAQAASLAKSEFLARMSHEIRTPMNAILGLSQLALRGELQARERDYLERTHRAAQSLLGIINDILDFSKVEAGKLSLETIPFRLDDVLDNLESVVSVKASEKGLQYQQPGRAADPWRAAGRSVAPGAGADEPRRQRREVHLARLGAVVGGAGRAQERRRHAALHRAGHGHRHDRGAAGWPVRELFPGGCVDVAPLRRHRPGACDQQAAGRGHGRADRGRQRGGQGQHVPFHDAPEGRVGVRAAGPGAARAGIAPRRRAAAGGRRQRHQPAHRPRDAGVGRRQRAHRVRWSRRDRNGRPASVRRGADGRAHAGDGRL